MRGFFQVKPVVVTSGAYTDDPSMVETMQEESDLSPPDSGGCAAVTLGYESDLANDEPIDMLSEDEGILEDAGKGSNERHKNGVGLLRFPRESSAVLHVTSTEKSSRKHWTQSRNLSGHAKPHLQAVIMVFRPSARGQSNAICS